MSEKPIINLDNLSTFNFGNDDKFDVRLGEIAIPLGLKHLGCLLHEVPAGKTAFPYHNHHNIDEMFVILDGQGEYRFGENVYAVTKGDILAAPAGGKEVAHQLLNTGDVTLRYLGISSQADPQVVEYPDSNKFLVNSMADNNDPRSARFRFIGREESGIDYFDGEE